MEACLARRPASIGVLTVPRAAAPAIAERLARSGVQGFGVGGVEGVLDVDEGRLAARLLGLGDHLQGDGRLAGGFRAVDLDNPALGDAADAEGDVKGEGARRDDVDVHRLVLPQPHQRARAVLLLDLGDNLVEGFLPLFAGAGDLGTGFVIRCFFCHIVCPSF